jgi:hypothetical protein
MTMFLTLLAAAVVVVIWRAIAVTASLDDAPHGRMSDRWLAELRASSKP